MDARTRKALEGSIAKWQSIVDGTGLDEGTENCPLCQLYYVRNSRSCGSCPVEADTEVDGCNGTPYEGWIDHHAECHPGQSSIGRRVIPGCDQCLSLAKAELDYLEWLLP